MHRAAIPFFGYLTLAVSWAACGPAPLETPDPEPPPSQGGTGLTGSGGSGGSGGAVGGVGGAVGGVGGAVGGVGGAVGGVGGAVGGVGGAVGGKGGAGTGGVVGGAGGTPPAAGGGAGTPATGGVGGGAGVGGATGGSAGAGDVPCEATMVVGSDGFVRAPGASGCWHGYASAGGDSTSTVMPTTFASCGMGCMLKASGTVGAAVEPTYAGVVYLGFNLNEATGGTKGTVVPKGTGLAVTYTNTGSSAIVRVQVSAGTTRWCAALMTSGTTIPWTTFNTECWEGGMGTAYGMQAIDTVQLIVPGGAMDAPFDITLVSVKDT